MITGDPGSKDRSRPMATMEHTINDAIAEILRSTRACWKTSNYISSENTGKLKGGSKRPDILVTEPNASPVVVETEVLPAVTVEVEARSRLGEKLATTGATILSAVAVRVPLEFRSKQSKSLEAGLASCTSFEFCLFTGISPTDCQRWPSAAWLVGSLEDLSLLVQAAAVPPEVIDAAANSLVEGVAEAAGMLAEVASHHPGVTHDIAAALHQEDEEQTRRMAATILANAFVFQETLAGGPGGLSAVRSLEMLKGAKSLTKSAVLDEWRRILDVNYWPIFDIARRILEVIPSAQTKSLIQTMADTAEKLLENRLMRSHDLTGAVFQRLIADRKFLAAFYTTPASAAFLVGLTISRAHSPGGGNWKDAKHLASIKIADFACGTGTLLSAAYQRIGQLHELSGGDSEAIHSAMMADAIVGCDVLPAAAHLTASMLAGAHPTTSFSDSGIMTLAYGKQGGKKNVTIALGSLDLLDQQQKMDIVALAATSLTGKGAGKKEVWKDIPDKSFNLVLMNPPFTRPTGHEGKKIGVPNPMFAAFSSSAEEQKLMGGAMKRLTNGTSYHGNAGEGSAFLALAHRKIAMGGTIGLILPQSFLTGDAWQKSRELIAKNYSGVVLASIAGTDGAEVSFSADTAIGECIVVGLRSAGGAKRATFIILNKRPSYPLEGAYTAQQVTKLLSSGPVRKLEDGPVGGTEISFGSDVIGSLIDAPLSLEGGWNLSRVRDFSLAQAAHALERDGTLWLPSMVKPDSGKLPITTVSKIGTIGPYHADVNGNTGDGGVRGPFNIKECANQAAATYPVLWAMDADHHSTLAFDGDSEGEEKSGKDKDERDLIKRKVELLAETMSHCHFNRDFRFNSQSLSMQFTPRPTIGGRSWLSIKLKSVDQEKALVLWANSTLGLLLHWWHGNKSQPGRSTIGKSTLEELPILNTTVMSASQLKESEKIFADLSALTLKPLYEISSDKIRRRLDSEFLGGVLGVQASLLSEHHAFSIVRAKLSAEPSIRGQK
jgi:hypothetical protein